MAVDDVKRKQAGMIGEEVAAKFLQNNGFTIIARNYRKPWGEIDIIAEKDNLVHFVEVKTLSRETLSDVSREKNDYRPEEQVHPTKLRKVARTAELYMQAKNDEREFQIDVVGVFLNMKTREARCRIYEQVL